MSFERCHWISVEPTMLAPCWFNGKAQNSKLWPCLFFWTPHNYRDAFTFSAMCWLWAVITGAKIIVGLLNYTFSDSSGPPNVLCLTAIARIWKGDQDPKCPWWFCTGYGAPEAKKRWWRGAPDLFVPGTVPLRISDCNFCLKSDSTFYGCFRIRISSPIYSDTLITPSWH